MKLCTQIKAASVACLLVLSLNVRAADKIVMSCANSSRDSIIDKTAKDFEKETGIQVVQFDENVRKPSNSAYFKDLLDGNVEAACASVAYADWLNILKADGVTVPSDVQITQRVVGRDLINLVTHKSAGVKELNFQQLELLFSPAAKNWKQLGGADLPIVVLSSKDKKNNRNAISKTVLHGKPFRTDFAETKDVNESIAKLSVTPGGFIVLGEKVTNPNTVTVKTPEIGRPITVITKGRPSEKMEKFIQFIRKASGTN